ncbi:sulfur carrier protein ThiS [Sulfurospirillum sp. T05]|uniref:Sulfur carrier protein ThiS n=1 Tax=Sulfurospirillum tamanense TaxID=2813362 RepID=A0ABS2WUJ7_9BACT|nr:sulfur carrier protein ThiS [Sulfurospirillum tamanensis]MBN2965327.1 sulfur carrier protein ThiS [Sulfurospirillum tamanensis]
MNIIVNGEAKETHVTTLLELMHELGIEPKVMAAAINMNVVKKEVWETTALSEGDKVELLHFVGGG